jgi:coenzyme F420-0:L-glutamate ligase / coenzyme F420-1:gamma-L-glutamate ligase
LNNKISIFGINGIPDVSQGDDIAAFIIDALEAQGDVMQDRDVIVITQKIVSIAEGRVVRPSDVEPSIFAMQLAEAVGKDPHEVEIVLRESSRIVRSANHVLITETRHGFICANSGVDKSNIPDGQAVLLPVDPDKSADTIRGRLEHHYGISLGVIISDTFGRPWRLGQTNVAIGISGLSAFADYRGLDDPFGNTMNVTQIAVSDELSSAAELVMGKFDRVPVAVVRGYNYTPAEDTAKSLIRPREKDIFQ